MAVIMPIRFSNLSLIGERSLLPEIYLPLG